MILPNRDQARRNPTTPEGQQEENAAMEKEAIRQRIREMGVDVVGFSDASRLADAPRGFGPADVLPDCRTVIAFAIRFPRGALHSPTPHIYTRIRNTISDKLDGIALDVCLFLESMGAPSVPIPTVEDIPDPNTGRYRSLVSLKHMAQAAGLGTIGRNTLLITPQYGSLVWLGGVLTEMEISPDPLVPAACTDCGLCVNACPVHALDGELLDQGACFSHAFGERDGMFTISCHACRDVCPLCLSGEAMDGRP